MTMAGHTTIQKRLRFRADYIKGLISPTDLTVQFLAESARQDGDMMYEAAAHIDALDPDLKTAKADANARASERDRLQAELTEVFRQRDKLYEQAEHNQREGVSYRSRIQTLERIVSDSETERAELRRERDKLAEAYANAVGAPGAVRGPVYEQVKAQILDDVHAIFRANGFKTSQLRAADARPRYYAVLVNGFGPGRQPRPWYTILDSTKPHKFFPNQHERVACAYNAADAVRIVDMLNS
jgi:hypothetical protein